MDGRSGGVALLGGSGGRKSAREMLRRWQGVGER